MKKMILLIGALPMFIFACSSCSGVQKKETESVKTEVPVAAVSKNATDLQGKWNIVKVGNQEIALEEMPFMDFNVNDKRLHANVGCNIMNASILLSDEDAAFLSIEPGQVTMMACPGMDIEQQILQAIPQVKGVKNGNADNEVWLIDENGNPVLILVQP